MTPASSTRSLWYRKWQYFSRGKLQAESLQEESQRSHDQLALQGVQKYFRRQIRNDGSKQKKCTRVFGNDFGIQDTWSSQDHNV